MTEPRRIQRGAPLSLRLKLGTMIKFRTLASPVEPETELRQSTELAFVPDEVVTRVLEEWRERTSYLPRGLLSDPAWGILLELLLAEIQGRRVSLLRIGKVAAVPASTRDRWLKALERHALIVRQADPLHPEDEMISLSRRGSSALRHYFHEVVQSG